MVSSQRPPGQFDGCGTVKTLTRLARLFNYYRTVATQQRDLEHPDVAAVPLTQLLSALGDPVRLGIVRQLASGPVEELSCQEVGGDLAKSTRSHHLRTLREAGIIRNVAHGRRRLVSLRREELDRCHPGLLEAVLHEST